MQYETTMSEIQQLTHERQQLWSKAGDGKATESDRERLGEITNKLAVLWDQYRREYAAGQRYGEAESSKPERNITEESGQRAA